MPGERCDAFRLSGDGITTMTLPHCLHFILKARPRTFSSPTYALPHLSQENFTPG
jgi:hypothetical protein